MNARIVIRVALALAAATALAACGVANPFAPAAAKTSSQDQLLKFAQCMRQHGIDMSDPVNGRIQFQSGGSNAQNSGPGPDSPQWQAAQEACKQYMPNGGNGNQGPSQQQLDQATKFAQCMRDHGVNMPDPQVAPGGGIMIRATPGPNGGGPQMDPNSDQFKQARQACAKYMPGSGSGPVTSGGGGGGVAIGGGQ